MAKILDAQGKPIDVGALKEPQTAHVSRLRDTYLTPMLDGLTPASLVRHLRAADNGDLTGQHRIFSDMEERDPHLKAEMGKRHLALLNLDWDIVPPRNANAAEKANAEWLKEVLTDAADPFEDLLLALMDGVGHGFAPVELEWYQEGRELLPRFHPRPQEWFRLSQDKRELRLLDNSPDGAALQPFGWAMHTHGKAKTGYLGRMGLYRVLAWPFLYKTYGLGDFAEFLEVYGLPIIVGKYYASATPEEKASLMHAVTALGHDARAIMPVDMQLEIQKITGGGDSTPHLSMVDWADRAQSKAILGQTLSAEAKSTGLGSNLANVHNEVRKDIRNADARQIAGTITRDVIYPMLVLNRGGIDSLSRCPRLVFDTGEAEDIKLMSESLPKLVEIGMQVPVQWAHDKLRIPQPAKDEPVLGKPAPAADKPEPPAALAVLAAKLAAPSVPDQAALDAAIDALPPELMQAQMADLLDALLAALEEADGFEKAKTILAERYPQLDAARLEKLLGRAMFVAELHGATSVEE